MKLCVSPFFLVIVISFPKLTLLAQMDNVVLKIGLSERDQATLTNGYEESIGSPTFQVGSLRSSLPAIM